MSEAAAKLSAKGAELICEIEKRLDEVAGIPILFVTFMLVEDGDSTRVEYISNFQGKAKFAKVLREIAENLERGVPMPQAHSRH